MKVKTKSRENVIISATYQHNNGNVHKQHHARIRNVKVNFDAEVQSCVDEGILQAVPRDCYVESVVPKMTGVQHVKGKTRPVLDYRALNKYVSNPSGSSITWDDKLRKSRCFEQCCVIELTQSIPVNALAKDKWKHQTVKWNNKYYYLISCRVISL